MNLKFVKMIKLLHRGRRAKRLVLCIYRGKPKLLRYLIGWGGSQYPKKSLHMDGPSLISMISCFGLYTINSAKFSSLLISVVDITPLYQFESVIINQPVLKQVSKVGPSLNQSAKHYSAYFHPSLLIRRAFCYRWNGHNYVQLFCDIYAQNLKV